MGIGGDCAEVEDAGCSVGIIIGDCIGGRSTISF